MTHLFEQKLNCPYCGELISALIDCSVEHQEYIEDCQVCCRPITFKIESLDGGDPLVSVCDENDVWLDRINIFLMTLLNNSSY